MKELEIMMGAGDVGGELFQEPFTHVLAALIGRIIDDVMIKCFSCREVIEARLVASVRQCKKRIEELEHVSLLPRSRVVLLKYRGAELRIPVPPEFE